ncbi:MAG: general secretion pathway protein GspK [Chitinophagaceae bacterium]|nr:general secretion pathway protein GspK [Chitinophagaceae bacterium]
MRRLIYILILIASGNAFAQQSDIDEDNQLNPAQLEDLSQDEESESENDYVLQQLDQYRKNPLDINSPEIAEPDLLDPLLIENLTSYRKLLGDILHINELQAVPGFTPDIIRKIRPFVTVRKDMASGTRFRHRFAKGNHSMLTRFAFTPEKARGFEKGSAQSFEGSRPAIFMRYKYQYRDLLQFGFLADKDAGEKKLLDFMSFHFFARHIGWIRSLALGDFTINFGQGLIQWQSQAYKKSSVVLNVKRQSEALRPYQSAGEYNFQRGIAATVERRRWQTTLFISYKKLSANIDDGSSGGKVITSIQTSGFHRTSSETSDKNTAAVLTTGANIKKLLKGGYVSLNAVGVKYNLPIEKAVEPYNYYAIAGKTFLNASADYSYTYRNIHLFGEFAVNRHLAGACISGMMTSLSSAVDLALLYRQIGKSYTSIYGNAFTESTLPANEKGFYTGISIKPHMQWRIDLYADLFSFAWLKYRLDAPADGFAYLVQVTYKPTRQTEIYSRYRYRAKPLNIDYEELKFPGLQEFSNWRTQISCQLTPCLLFRSRVELCIYDHRFLEFPEPGSLFFTELHFKPRAFWLSGSIRFQAFEAASYETRLYAYENDVLYVSSTPSYYNNGVRYYLNLKAKVRTKWLSNKSLTISFKAASTVYTNISAIGTGVSEIAGTRISSLKLQFFLTE